MHAVGAECRHACSAHYNTGGDGRSDGGAVSCRWCTMTRGALAINDIAMQVKADN